MNERTTKKVPYKIHPNKKYLNTKLSFKKENITSILLLLIRTVAFIVQVQSINKRSFRHCRLIILRFEDGKIEDKNNELWIYKF